MLRSIALLKVGLIGTVFAALCCFTPILVVMVGAVGLSALTGYLDYVLFPMLGLFLLLTLYAILHRKKSAPSISKENKNV